MKFIDRLLYLIALRILLKIRKKITAVGCTARQIETLESAINDLRYYGCLKMYIDWEDIKKWS